MDIPIGIAVVIATFLGPVAAVLVSRFIDKNRQRRARQMDVFRAIMGTRRAILSPDRVKALNMVEIEFYKIRTVEEAYRDLMDHINTPRPLPWL